MAFVPSASAFSLPLPSWQQNSSIRVAKYESRKRKKYDTGEDETDNNYGGGDGETTDAASESAFTGPPVILSPAEAHQYRIAGLSFDEELPGGNFPHGPVKEKTKVENHGSILKQLSSLSPPMYAPQSAAHQGNLRLHHLAVLTSVLHRCLLDGDYIRAGRAWGLIIREQFGGNSIDVRTEDRWGIGAEILLRKDCQKSDSLLDGGRVGSDVPPGRDKLLFTRKGFEDAKQYYETLIIQHPFQKTAPHAISALHFYPAMFGLWIYVTQEESKTERRALEDRNNASFRESWDDEDAESEIDSHNDPTEKRQALAASIKTTELAQAQKIAARMDEVISSPPYSDTPELLELRGMVSFWIADLLVSSLPTGKADDYNDEDIEDRHYVDNDDDVFMSSDAPPGSVFARRERRLAMEKRQTEMNMATEFMDKARQRRQGVASKLEGLHIDDDVSLHSLEPYYSS